MEALENQPLADQIGRIAVLDEPLRRALYLFVAGQGGDVSRDQAARALQVSRPLAAFHLDKLVEGGFLEVTHRRVSGRSGPGAGRPSKLYRRSRQQVEVSLPERRYQIAAQLLLEAIEQMPPNSVRDALHVAARGWGQRLGVEARARAGPHVTPERLFEEALKVLRQNGFEPRWDATGKLLLHNCPFEALATEHRALVCNMNFALMEGLLVGLELEGITAKLEPQPGMCCVLLHVDPSSPHHSGWDTATRP